MEYRVATAVYSPTYLGRTDLAQVIPEDLRVDTVGETDAAMPDQSEVVLQVNEPVAAGTTAVMSASAGSGRPRTLTRSVADQLQNQISVARAQGYEGDACGECGSFTMVRNGTCLKCMSCGATSGCS